MSGTRRDFRGALLQDLEGGFLGSPKGPQGGIPLPGQQNPQALDRRENPFKESRIPAFPPIAGFLQVHDIVADMRQSVVPPSERAGE